MLDVVFAGLIIIFIIIIPLLFIIGIPALFIGAKVSDKYDEIKGEKDLKTTFLCDVCNSENNVWYKIGTPKDTVFEFECWNCKTINQKNLKGERIVKQEVWEKEDNRKTKSHAKITTNNEFTKQSKRKNISYIVLGIILVLFTPYDGILFILFLIGLILIIKGIYGLYVK